MICSNCGKPVADGSSFCSNCGKPIARAKKICSNCGAELEEENLFCWKCGHKTDLEGATETQEESRSASDSAFQEEANFDLTQQSSEGYQNMDVPTRVLQPKSFWKYFLLGMITCGIYSIYTMWHVTNDINEICADDGKPSRNYIIVVLLSAVTFGIYGMYWYYCQGKRLYEVAPKYGVDISEKGIVYLIWMIFLSTAGGLVSSYLLFRNLNKCIAAYNCGSRSHAVPRMEEASTKQKALLGTAIGVRALILVAVIAAIISMESFISDAGSEPVSDTTDTQTEAKQEKTKQEAPKYILPGSDSKYLESSDLEKLGKWDCVLARNEIYARHGRIFEDTDIKNYFNKQSWYKPTVQPSEFKESMLNKYEQYNVTYIVEYEVSKGYRNPPQETVHKVSDMYELLSGDDLENKKVSVPGRIEKFDAGYALCYGESDYGLYLCDLGDYDVDFIISNGGYCTVTGLFYYDDSGEPYIDVDDIDFECN